MRGLSCEESLARRLQGDCLLQVVSGKELLGVGCHEESLVMRSLSSARSLSRGVSCEESLAREESLVRRRSLLGGGVSREESLARSLSRREESLVWRIPSLRGVSLTRNPSRGVSQG